MELNLILSRTLKRFNSTEGCHWNLICYKEQVRILEKRRPDLIKNGFFVLTKETDCFGNGALHFFFRTSISVKGFLNFGCRFSIPDFRFRFAKEVDMHTSEMFT